MRCHPSFPQRALLPALLALVPGVCCLWPQPASMSSGNGVRMVSPDLSISIPTSHSGDIDLHEACQRALGRVKNLPFYLYSEDRGASHQQQALTSTPLTQLKIEIGGDRGVGQHFSWDEKAINQSAVDFPQADALVFQGRSSSPSSITSLILQPLETLEESYTLSVPSGQGAAVISAKNSLGALRGLATFTQTVYMLPGTGKDVQPGGLYVRDLPIHIKDKAAFPYRGIMLDTARNFLPVESIKKTLDAMETVKLNQLHWHMVDAHSWPVALETKGLGILVEKGAYGPANERMIYDKETVAHIVEYAAKRGVNVVMEFDMPGHMNAGVRDYPGELIICDNKKNWTDWAAEPPSGHLDIRKPAATQFAKDLLSEVVTFHPGLYISTGNDEVQPHCYGLARSDKAGADKLLAPFVDAVHSHLVDLKKVPVVWEEAALHFPKTAKVLKEGTLVEAWTGSDNVERLLKSSDIIRLIHAPVDFFYLDCGMGGWLSNAPQGQSWCSFVTWQKQYSFDPYNGTANVRGGRERIMGGESALWAEQVDSANLDSLLWPRAASGAEVFWTGAKFTHNEKTEDRSLKQADPRMHEIRGRIRSMGILASAIQPHWCALRPGRCNLS